VLPFDELILPPANNRGQCVAELRVKARYFEQTSIIPILDASAAVVKSDSLVPASLRDRLRAAFARLQREQAAAPDWHPRSDDKVQDLVHPSLYPLVYGRSRAFTDEVVGVAGSVDKWAGKGSVLPEPEEANWSPRFAAGTPSGPPADYWSSTYQWLPANVTFREGGVKFSSYVNNLHPDKHPEIYGALEDLIALAIPAWNQCLTLYEAWTEVGGAGCSGSRFPQPPADDCK
jgi:hypothetical protein